MADKYSRHPRLRGDAIAPSASESSVSPPSPGDPLWSTPKNSTEPLQPQPVGTKLVGYGENITSGGLNRALTAIQENVDLLHHRTHTEVAIPQTTDVKVAGWLAGVTITVGTDAAPVRVYVKGTDPTTLFSVLDQNFNEIIKDDGIELVVNAVKTTSGAAANGDIILHDQQAITTFTKYSVVCNGASFTKNPANDFRPICPGDKVVFGGVDIGDGGTWVVQAIISATEIEVRRVEDPSKPLQRPGGTPWPTPPGGAYGHVTIRSTGSFYVNPVLTLNYDPVAATLPHPTPNIAKIYLVYAASNQPIPSLAAGLTLPVEAAYPLEEDSLVKIKIRASEEQDALREWLGTCGLDEAYDRDLSRKDSNPLGSGRSITVDGGSVRFVTGANGPWATHLPAAGPDYQKQARYLNTLLDLDVGSDKEGSIGCLVQETGEPVAADFMSISKYFASVVGIQNVAVTLVVSATGPDRIQFAGGTNLSKVIPRATICHLQGFEINNAPYYEGFYLVVEVDDANDQLSLQYLSELSAPNNFANFNQGAAPGAGTATLYSLKFRVGSEIRDNMGIHVEQALGQYAGADLSTVCQLQVAGNAGHQTMFRSLYVGTSDATYLGNAANNSNHISCLSHTGGRDFRDLATAGQLNDVAFQVKTGKLIRVGGEIQDVYTSPTTRSLNLNEGGAGNKILLSIDDGAGVYTKLTVDQATLGFNKITWSGNPPPGGAKQVLDFLVTSAEEVKGTFQSTGESASLVVQSDGATDNASVTAYASHAGGGTTAYVQAHVAQASSKAEIRALNSVNYANEFLQTSVVSLNSSLGATGAQAAGVLDSSKRVFGLTFRPTYHNTSDIRFFHANHYQEWITLPDAATLRRPNTAIYGFGGPSTSYGQKTNDVTMGYVKDKESTVLRFGGASDHLGAGAGHSNPQIRYIRDDAGAAATDQNATWLGANFTTFNDSGNVAVNGVFNNRNPKAFLCMGFHDTFQDRHTPAGVVASELGNYSQFVLTDLGDIYLGRGFSGNILREVSGADGTTHEVGNAASGISIRFASGSAGLSIYDHDLAGAGRLAHKFEATGNQETYGDIDTYGPLVTGQPGAAGPGGAGKVSAASHVETMDTFRYITGTRNTKYQYRRLTWTPYDCRPDVLMRDYAGGGIGSVVWQSLQLPAGQGVVGTGIQIHRFFVDHTGGLSRHKDAIGYGTASGGLFGGNNHPYANENGDPEYAWIPIHLPHGAILADFDVSWGYFDNSPAQGPLRLELVRRPLFPLSTDGAWTGAGETLAPVVNHDTGAAAWGLVGPPTSLLTGNAAQQTWLDATGGAAAADLADLSGGHSYFQSYSHTGANVDVRIYERDDALITDPNAVAGSEEAAVAIVNNHRYMYALRIKMMADAHVRIYGGSVLYRYNSLDQAC